MLHNESDEGTAESIKIIASLREYIINTDLPILREFCAENNYPEENIISLAAENRLIGIFLNLMETKKRAKLERMIYNGELNATIGLHLLKSWGEVKLPDKLPPEPWITKLSAKEAKQYHTLTHKIHGLSAVRDKFPNLAD